MKSECDNAAVVCDRRRTIISLIRKLSETRSSMHTSQMISNVRLRHASAEAAVQLCCAWCAQLTMLLTIPRWTAYGHQSKEDRSTIDRNTQKSSSGHWTTRGCHLYHIVVWYASWRIRDLSSTPSPLSWN